MIPDGTTKIAEEAFLCDGNADSYEKIVIPDSVKEIGKSAFYGRKKLRSINIPNGVEKK